MCQRICHRTRERRGQPDVGRGQKRREGRVEEGAGRLEVTRGELEELHEPALLDERERLALEHVLFARWDRRHVALVITIVIATATAIGGGAAVHPDRIEQLKRAVARDARPDEGIDERAGGGHDAGREGERKVARAGEEVRGERHRVAERRDVQGRGRLRDERAERGERQRRVPPAVLWRRVDMEHLESRFGECAGPANSAQRQFGCWGLLQGGAARAYAATMDSVRLVLMTRTSNSVSSIMYRCRKRNPRRCGSRCKVVAVQITCLLASAAYPFCKHPSNLGGNVSFSSYWPP
jgi:hypothetical protein